MYAEVAWVLVSSGTQVQPQVILDPDYLPDCLSISYDYVKNHIELSVRKSSQIKLLTNKTVNSSDGLSKL